MIWIKNMRLNHQTAKAMKKKLIMMQKNEQNELEEVTNE